MNARMMTCMLLLVAATAALAPGASAQEAAALSGAETQQAVVQRIGDEADPNQFGTSGWFEKVIPVAAFTGADGGTLVYAEPAMATTATTTGALFWAPLEMAPGTEVQKVCLFVKDNSTTHAVSFYWMLASMGTSPAKSYLASGGTGNAETPGFTWVCAQPASPVLIRAYSSGDNERYAHVLMLTAMMDAQLAWGGAVVTWRRALSPAPATATFPTDVPTTHPFYQYVEALAASGITAGCGPGVYCPDQPLTRGQMAVFLSKALGLYWPY